MSKCMRFTRLPMIKYFGILSKLKHMPFEAGKSNLCVSQCALSDVKMTRMLEKMIKKKTLGSKKKTWYMYLPPTSSEGPSLGSQSKKPQYSDGQRRRAAHVARVLFDYISDLISTGEVDPLLVEKAVEVVKAVVVPDFSTVHVYWLGSGDETADQQIQELLDKNAPRIRHLLCSYRVIANVPRLVFIRDTSVAKLVEIERLLKVADFGPGDDSELPGHHAPEIMTTDPTCDHFEKRRQSTQQSMAQNFERLSQVMSRVNLDQFPNVTYMGQGDRNSTTKSDMPTADVKSTDQLTLQDRDEMANSDKAIRYNSLPEDSEINAVSTPDLKFRNDLYEIDHTRFISQVMITKQKTKHRNFAWSESELQTSENQMNSKEHVNAWDQKAYKKLLKIKKPKPKDLSTNVRYLDDFSDNNVEWNRSVNELEDDYEDDDSDESRRY